MADDMGDPSGPGSQATPEAASASSPSVSIPIAEDDWNDLMRAIEEAKARGRAAAEKAGEYDCPDNAIEVRRNEDGSLDEICAGEPAGKGLFIHLEQMAPNVWWLAIYNRGYRQVVWFRARGKITARSEMDDWPQPDGAPDAQGGETRRAETGTGSVHEHPVTEGHAPESSSSPGQSAAHRGG